MQFGSIFCPNLFQLVFFTAGFPHTVFIIHYVFFIIIFCIIFNIINISSRNLVTYFTAPQYLLDLLHTHTPSRILRSSSKTLLSVVRPRLDSYESSAFSFAAPLLWNELPDYITGEQTLTSW